MLALTLDGLILGLLLIVIGLGLRIHLGLRRMRHDEGALRRLIGALDAAIERADASLAELRQVADATGQRLDGDLTRARRLLDDLQFLSDRGAQLADRLADGIRRGRDGPARPRPARAAPASTVPARVAPGAGATDQLERTLDGLR